MTILPAETADAPTADATDDVRSESVSQVFARVIKDGRAYARAEADKQKARAGIVMGGVRNAAIFGLVALILVFAAIVTLLVGLVFALAVQVGPFWATLIVVGGALIVAIALLLAAKGSISSMMRKIRP